MDLWRTFQIQAIGLYNSNLIWLTPQVVIVVGGGPDVSLICDNSCWTAVDGWRNEES
jgi:hypothetical protein